MTSVLSNPDFAAFIGLSNEVSEFPLVWCNTGSEVYITTKVLLKSAFGSLSFNLQRINYALTLESSNPNNLAHPLVSVHNTGVLPTTPYRMPCNVSTNNLLCLPVVSRVPGLFSLPL